MAVEKTEGPVSAREVQKLLKLGWERDDALSDRWAEARILSDGRALMFHGDGIYGVIFASREALAEQRRKGAEELAKGPVDLVGTLLPPLADFIRDAETHARSVGTVLRIPDDALDFTEASLDAVDAALMRVRPAAKRMTPEIVTPVYAYVGEVMRRGCGGTWRATTTRREPVIEARDGKYLSPFRLVVVPMVEPSKRVQLRHGVDIFLLSYRPGYVAGPPGTLTNPVGRPVPSLADPSKGSRS